MGGREMVHCCRGLLRPEGSPSEPAGGREGTRHSFQFVPNFSCNKSRGIFSREGSYQEGHKVVNNSLETIRRIDPVPSVASVPDPIHHQSELESQEISSERACGPVTLQLKTGRDKSKTPSSPLCPLQRPFCRLFPPSPLQPPPRTPFPCPSRDPPPPLLLEPLMSLNRTSGENCDQDINSKITREWRSLAREEYSRSLGRSKWGRNPNKERKSISIAILLIEK